MTQNITHLRRDGDDRFSWTRFYETMADRLLTFRDRRDELMGGIHAMAAKMGVSGLRDRFSDGSSGPLKDICPFTVLGLFNRGAGVEKQKGIAHELAKLLNVPTEDVPDSFEGIPFFQWKFFPYEKTGRQAADIDALWEVFAQAIAFVQADSEDLRSSFIAAYDNATQGSEVKWNLTTGLFWMRPRHFPALGTPSSQQYVEKNLNIPIGKHGPNGCCNASDYLEVREALATQFHKAACPVGSFPELALEAEKGKDTKPDPINDIEPYTDCAQKVLEKFGDQRPMHYKEITAKALEQGWLAMRGKTTEASMYAQIITEIKRQRKRGERPRFVQHDHGYVGLSQWQGGGLASQIEQHNQQVRETLRDRLWAMQPSEFEELVSRLLAEMGFESVEVTKFGGDGGIDVRGTLVVGDVVQIKMAVQVKKWKRKNNVSAPVVQQVRGSLGAHEQGLIITTSDFSTGARNEAAQPDKIPIALMNGEQLVMLLMEYGIGVQGLTLNLFEIDEEALVLGGDK